MAAAPRPGTWTATASSISRPASRSARPATRTRGSSRRCRRRPAKFLHISSDYWHEEMTALAERLSAIVPLGEPGMCFFCQSGTESVEGALKLARYATKRQRIIAFPRQLPRPHDGLAVADLQQVHAAGGLLRRPCRASRTSPTRIPIDRCSRAPIRARGARLHPHAVRAERAGDGSRRDRHRAAAGRGRLSRAAGRIPAGLRQLCDEHGILLVFDEVQSGIGRTGRMFARAAFRRDSPTS